MPDFDKFQVIATKNKKRWLKLTNGRMYGKGLMICEKCGRKIVNDTCEHCDCKEGTIICEVCGIYLEKYPCRLCEHEPNKKDNEAIRKSHKVYINRLTAIIQSLERQLRVYEGKIERSKVKFSIDYSEKNPKPKSKHYLKGLNSVWSVEEFKDFFEGFKKRSKTNIKLSRLREARKNE